MRRKVAVATGLATAAAVLPAVPYVAELTPRAAAGPPLTVICPLPASPAALMWAFSATRSLNRGTHIHGRGSYTLTRASGTACEQDIGGATDVVLSIQGRGKLSRGISRGGTIGAQLVLKVRIANTDLAGCRVGERGTLALFSSYSGAHRDSVKLKLRRCGGETLTVANAIVHVSIPR